MGNELTWKWSELAMSNAAKPFLLLNWKFTRNDHLSWDIWTSVLTIILSNQCMQLWWSTGFQHQIRIEKRQLTLLNYGLSRQQLFSRSQKQMSAICKPQAIQILSTEERIRIRISNCIIYLVIMQRLWKSTKLRRLNKCSDKCSVKSRHVTLNPNDQRVSNMR